MELRACTRLTRGPGEMATDSSPVIASSPAVPSGGPGRPLATRGRHEHAGRTGSPAGATRPPAVQDTTAAPVHWAVVGALSNEPPSLARLWPRGAAWARAVELQEPPQREPQPKRPAARAAHLHLLGRRPWSPALSATDLQILRCGSAPLAEEPLPRGGTRRRPAPPAHATTELLEWRPPEQPQGYLPRARHPRRAPESQCSPEETSLAPARRRTSSSSLLLGSSPPVAAAQWWCRAAPAFCGSARRPLGLHRRSRAHSRPSLCLDPGPPGGRRRLSGHGPAARWLAETQSHPRTMGDGDSSRRT